MIRNIRYRRDQRQLEEEEEMWFNEEDDFSDVPAAKPEIESYSMMKSECICKCIQGTEANKRTIFSVEKNGPSKPNSSSPPTSTNSHSPTNTLSSAPANQADSPPRQPDSSTLDQKSNSSAQPTVAANVTGLNSTNPIDKPILKTEDTEEVTSRIIDTPEMTTGSLQKVSLLVIHNGCFYVKFWILQQEIKAQ